MDQKSEETIEMDDDHGGLAPMVQGFRQSILEKREPSMAGADGLDGDRYLGLVFGEPPRNILIDDSSILIRPEVAAKQIADEAPDPVGENGKDGQEGGGDGPPPPPPPVSTSPRRFYGTTKLNAARLSSSAGQIGDEIVQHLKALVGADVEITLEIHATVPEGIPDNVVRTISENAATLKFDQFGFEEE